MQPCVINFSDYFHRAMSIVKVRQNDTGRVSGEGLDE